MAGHSKWATTKRHKAAQDAKRGKMFSVLSKELTIAARSGGGDPEFNPRLRTLIDKAKSANMPNDNIDRAIKKGTGALGDQIIEEVLYEGYGPGGVGILVEATTDNKNRTASEVRSTFTKAGGNLAVPGALSFNFQRLGEILIPRNVIEEDALMTLALDLGVEDFIATEEGYELRCAVNDFDKILKTLKENTISTESAEIVYQPNNYSVITDVDLIRRNLSLIEQLDNLEDVKSVWPNLDVTDELLGKVESNTK